MDMVWNRFAMKSLPKWSAKNCVIGESSACPAMRPYQQSNAINVIMPSMNSSTNTTAVSEYRTFHGIRLMNFSRYGSTNLIQASPIIPQNTMYLPEVRPPIDSHSPV